MNKKNFFFTQYTEELYKNQKYETYPDLLGVIGPLQQDIIQSLRADEGIKRHGIANRYILETKERITSITTHSGLDLWIQQYQKKERNRNKKFVNYSPYSDTGYYVFMHLLTAWGHIYGRDNKISLDFHVSDQHEGDRSIETNPMKQDLLGSIFYGNARFLLTEEGNLMNTDDEGIVRLGSHVDWQGFGLDNNRAVLQFSTGMGRQKDDICRLIFENELLPLYMQLYINIVRCVSGGNNAVNIKKLYEYIYYLGLNKQNKQEKVMNFIERTYKETNSTL